MKSIFCVVLLLSFCTNLHSQETTDSLKYKEGDKIFKVVEQMPRFPGCEDIDGDHVEKKNVLKKN